MWLNGFSVFSAPSDSTCPMSCSFTPALLWPSSRSFWHRQVPADLSHWEQHVWLSRIALGREQALHRGATISFAVLVWFDMLTPLDTHYFSFPASVTPPLLLEFSCQVRCSGWKSRGRTLAEPLNSLHGFSWEKDKRWPTSTVPPVYWLWYLCQGILRPAEWFPSWFNHRGPAVEGITHLYCIHENY